MQSILVIQILIKSALGDIHLIGIPQTQDLTVLVNIWRCFVAKEPIVNLRFTSGSSKKVVYLFLAQEVKFQGKKERGIRKRHSSGELELKSRGTQNIPPKKRDKVFDKIDIKDRKEKFLNLENKAKKVSWVDPNNFNILKFSVCLLSVVVS